MKDDKKRKNKSKARRGARASTPKFTAKTADRHDLYQRSVQDPPTEIEFIDRIYRRAYGRRPMRLREDFCGTALFCADWVQGASGRSALGIDLDQPTLDWGVEHNLAPIGEPGQRVRLLCQDVCDLAPGEHEVAVALNFSYWVFMERSKMVSYFRAVRQSLASEALFVLDAYGGPLSMEAMDDADLEKTKVKGGFTYVWHQANFNAIDHRITNHIHFEFKDGTALRKAFTYHWRFWTLPEIQEMLAEAGFSGSQVYWEDEDEDGDGTGVYRARKRADNTGAWVAYIVART